MHPIRLVTYAALVILCAGCEAGLMKTPSVATVGLIDPFEAVPPDRQGNDVPVFVASARTVSGRSRPAEFYTRERSREVRLGRAAVTIGPGMSWDEVAHASRAVKREHNPAIELARYEEYGPLWTSAWPPDLRFDPEWDPDHVDRGPADRFAEAINEQLEASRRRQITVYVHGFNTVFGKNVELAGEFWHFMARDGAILSFDWASEGSLFSYETDKLNAAFAIRQFRVLLQFLAESTIAEEINIIGHSAGTVVVVEALRQLSLIHYDADSAEAQRRTRISQVVLAAPDLDYETALSASIDGAGRVTSQTIIYASRRDRALGLSGNIFHDVRLGNSIGRIPDADRDALIRTNAQWIDVGVAVSHSSSFLGHSYYHQNPWVSSDMFLFLVLGATPEDRGLTRDLTTGFLVFPDDYVDQLPEIIERIRASEQAGAD